MNILFLSCCLIILFTSICATLSPNNDKKAKKQDKLIRKSGITTSDVFQRGLVIKNVKAQDILRESGLYSINTKLRHYVPGNILGYVTPWNPVGYENAKTFHGKYDMISPIWLTFTSNDPKFQVSTHDFQRAWLEDMKAANNDNHTVTILPRVLFEGWSKNSIIDLANNFEKKDKLISRLVKLSKAHSFDGYVFEIWNQFLSSGVKKKMIISIITYVADALRNHNLDIILAIPPMRGNNREPFNQKNFNALAPHIRYFSLMTYDFSNVMRPGPNAPVDWIKACVELLVPDVKDIKRSQILLGLNFYGYHYTTAGGSAIIGPEYLNLLQDFRGKLKWDDKSQEHYFEVKSTESGFVFYPTLYSIMSRLELAVELKTGISIWELGQGLTYFHDIL